MSGVDGRRHAQTPHLVVASGVGFPRSTRQFAGLRCRTIMPVVVGGMMGMTGAS